MYDDMDTRSDNPEPHEDPAPPPEQSTPGEERYATYESTEPPKPFEDTIASVDIVSGEKKITMSAPVREFEEFKESFTSMMFAFANFIEAAGMEIGKDETKEQVNILTAQLQQLKDDVKADEEKMNESMVPRDEFEAFKAEAAEKNAEAAENYVRRAEFEKFRQTIRDAI